VQKLAHPALATVFGAGRLADGRPWYAMELLEGRDLAAVLLDRGALPPEEAYALLEPLAGALATAHARGVIHRDVKAQNVFVTDAGRVVLLDFGVAKLTDPGEASLSVSGMAIGTPSCMAPEQSAGGAVDARTDVYALGVLAYHLLAGELPFADASPAIMRQLHRWARRPRPGSRVRLSPELDAVIVRAMARAPEQRFASAEEFLAAYKEALATGESAAAAVCGPSLAVHLEVHEDGDGCADLAVLEAALPMAIEGFAGQGFVIAAELGNAAVMVRACAEPGPTPDERRAAIELARALSQQVRERGHGALALRVYLDVQRAELAGGRVVGGQVLRLGTWLPEESVAGVSGSSRALAGVELPGGEPS
jgi:serine/threonine-protein kinase